MPRGGRRQGKPGRSYASRTDLNAGSNVVPMMAATGQPYGARAAQMAAQRAIPVAAPPPPAVGPVAPSPATGPAPTAGPGGATPPGPVGPLPGELGPLDADTTRPGEPVTAGVPVGPGPGVEVLGMGEEDTGVADLAMYLPMLEMLASRPGATAQTRNFVRRLRGAAPVQS